MPADTIGGVTSPALHAEALPRRTAWLPATGGHTLHLREWGHPDGLPVVVLHGGPGSGASPALARFFDPQRYRVIVPDQRGAGGSRPRGATHDNTTVDLLADLRALRKQLGIERWLVVGGSWGATLALLHALDEPSAVTGLLLRSTFLARAEDIAWFFQGAAEEAADAWQDFAAVAPAARRSALLPFFAQQLHIDDVATRHAVALAWWRWEQTLARSTTASSTTPDDAMLDALVDRYRVQSHYMLHQCWVDPPLPDRCAELPRVPTLLLHGTQDRICRPEGAMLLHARLPHSCLQWAPDVGHDPFHPTMASAMVRSLDGFAATGRFDPDFDPAHDPAP